MGEKGILGFTGGLVIYSAVNEKFKVPAEVWGVATAAAAYYFSTAKRIVKGKDDEEEEGEEKE
jgi:uncharacterized membrane protein